MTELERRDILKAITKKMAEDEYEKTEFSRVLIQRQIFKTEDLKIFIKELKRETKNRNIKKINCSFEVIYKEKFCLKNN